MRWLTGLSPLSTFFYWNDNVHYRPGVSISECPSAGHRLAGQPRSQLRDPLAPSGIHSRPQTSDRKVREKRRITIIFLLTYAQARHTLYADRERRGGAGARRVQDVHGIDLVDEVEILHQFALRGDGLGADAGTARIEIRCADLRDQALQRFGEEALAERAFDFLPAHACVTRQKVPQSRIGNSVEEVAWIDIRLAVTFAREGEHSVRTCFDTAVNQTREVHAEEGKLRIGHGVDQVANERLAVRLDLVILAAKWNNANFAAQTGQFADAITVKACAVDQELSFEVSRFGFGRSRPRCRSVAANVLWRRLRRGRGCISPGLRRLFR